MKTPPATFSRDRLVKALRLLGSDQLGERAAAGAAADHIIREAGLDWDDVVRAAEEMRHGAGYPPASDLAASRWRPDVVWLGRRVHLLTRWERDFVASICGRHRLSDRQLEILRQIVADVTAREAAAA